MYILAVLSFLALAWAAIAIAGHIRKGGAKGSKPPADPDMAEAIDLRLTTLVPPARDLTSSLPQDFSYFNREAAPHTISDTEDHSRAAADRK